jgi:hypothetical protein
LYIDLFHPECIDVYASSLPAHTAKAGYLCPVCSVSISSSDSHIVIQKPLFPSDDNNPLAQHLNNHLSEAAWSKSMITVKPDTSINQQTGN